VRHRLVLLPVLVATLVGAPPALAWTWPADGPVLQPFVLGDDPYAAGQHRGIDVAGIAGAPVHAPAGGSVSFAGTVPGGGRTVTIQTADGYAVTLLHLGTLGVSRGVVIDEGATVGTLGMSGDAEHAVPSVHFGVRVAADPQGYLDPLLFLPARGPVDGEVVAPAAEVEPVPAPAPPESVETGGPPLAGAGTEPGGFEGTDPVASPSPAGVELPVAPGIPAETPTPAVVDAPSPVADARGSTAPEDGSTVEAAAPTAVADGASLPRARADSARDGPPRAEAAVAESGGAPTRTARPEPAVRSVAADEPEGVRTADSPAIPLSLVGTAVVALLAAGAFGLRFRRRIPAAALRPAVASADEDAQLIPETFEQLVVAGPRRRTRGPGGPGRRLERLGPHGDGAEGAQSGLRRPRSEAVDARR
jgi:hypothetical protein